MAQLVETRVEEDEDDAVASIFRDIEAFDQGERDSSRFRIRS